jgi:hypothetical protein
MYLSNSEAKIKRAAEASLFYFIDGILGTEPGFDQLSPNLHAECCEFLQDPLHKRKLMMIPRDHFKSTLLKGQVLHFLIQPKDNNCYFPGKPGEETCMLIGFDALENATKFVGVIQHIIENHKMFKHFWPHIKPGGRWTQTVFNVQRNVHFGEATLEAVSINSPIASRHVDVFFKDDIFTFKAMIEPPTAEKTLLWHQSSISVFRQNNHSFEIVAGTPWAQNDVYTFIMQKQKYFSIYHRAVVENDQPIFPERYSLDDIEQIRQTFEGTGLFELNYMCDHSGGILSDFKRDWFKSFRFDPSGGVINFEAVAKQQETPLAQAVASAMGGLPSDPQMELLKRVLKVAV